MDGNSHGSGFGDFHPLARQECPNVVIRLDLQISIFTCHAEPQILNQGIGLLTIAKQGLLDFEFFMHISRNVTGDFAAS